MNNIKFQNKLFLMLLNTKYMWRQLKYLSKSILCLALLSSSLNSNCQVTKKIDAIRNSIVFSTCDLNPFVLDDGSLGVNFISTEGLSKYFHKRLDSLVLNNLEGEVLIQVLIDKKGRACCKEISSLAGINIQRIDSLKLESIINNMPKWKPAHMNGKLWNCSTLVRLNFLGPLGLNASINRSRVIQ